MIRAEGVEKSFDEIRVLRGVDLHIEKSCMFGLAGRSGEGKSTILRCINGLEEYDGGSLVVDGVEVNTLREKELREFRKNIGMVFQGFSLLERLTVFENVALPLRCWKYESGYVRRKVHELLELVGLDHKSSDKPRSLSGGQKQRVAAARALSLSPNILLCDEATSALDPKTAQEILSLFRSINTRLSITVVMVTHQMSVLSSACMEMAVLEKGRIAESGSVEELFRRPPPALVHLTGEGAGPVSGGGTAAIRISANDMFTARMAADLNLELSVIPDNDRYDHVLLRFPEDAFSAVANYISARKTDWAPADSADDRITLSESVSSKESGESLRGGTAP